MKTNPRRTYYGGSQDAYNDITGGYADATNAAGGRVDAGVGGLAGGAQVGGQIAQRGFGLMDRALAQRPSNAGVGALSSLNPAAVAQAQAQRTLDANAAATLGAARSGGAMGLRQGLLANAAAGVDASAAAATAGMMGEQQKQVAIAQAQQQNQALDAQRQLQLLTAGGQLAQGGNAQALTAAGQTAQVGLGQQNLFQDALQSTQDRQFSADIDYEQRRQQERQRKSNNLWQLAGNLIGGGTSMISSAAGKGGK